MVEFGSPFEARVTLATLDAGRFDSCPSLFADWFPGGSVSDHQVDNGRRRVLIGLSAAVWGVGVAGAAVPFVKSWTPSAKARAAGAAIKIDISKLEPGALLGPMQAWRGKPVFVLKRTPEMLKNLEQLTSGLADPGSETPQQPAYAKNAARSRKPEIGVFVGICTHLGCSPKYQGADTVEVAATKGGFFCPCHGSKFDFAGRVYANMPAPANLQVPPYSFESDSVIVIGVDEENA